MGLSTLNCKQSSLTNMMKIIILATILSTSIYKKCNAECTTPDIWLPNLSPSYILLQPWSKQLKLNLLNNSNKDKDQTILLLKLALMLSGDIQLNSGPHRRNVTVNPCGLCERPVTWSCEGVCCDDCNVWHHRSCIELRTYDYELLQKSNIQWMCCKCDSLNVDSFTYHSFELHTTNMFWPLSKSNITINSESDTSVFNPVHTSSPKTSNTSQNSKNRSRSSRTESTKSNVFNLPPKENLRIMTVNCRSVIEKKTELSACINYIKPDIICGTESWLKEIHPGKPPKKDAIKSTEVFPENYKFYRNDSWGWSFCRYT